MTVEQIKAKIEANNKAIKKYHYLPEVEKIKAENKRLEKMLKNLEPKQIKKIVKEQS